MIINFNNLGASGGGSGSGSTVSWRQDLTAGTQIAQITINGTPQSVYAPSGGSGSDIIQNYQIVSALTEVEGEESSVTYSGYTFDFSGVTVDTEGGITSGEDIYADIAYKLSEGGAMYLTDTTTWEQNPIDDDNQWHNYYGDVFIKRNGSFVSVIFAGYTGEELVEFFDMEAWQPSEEVVTGTTSDTVVAVVVLEGTVAGLIGMASAATSGLSMWFGMEDDNESVTWDGGSFGVSYSYSEGKFYAIGFNNNEAFENEDWQREANIAYRAYGNEVDIAFYEGVALDPEDATKVGNCTTWIQDFGEIPIFENACTFYQRINNNWVEIELGGGSTAASEYLPSINSLPSYPESGAVYNYNGKLIKYVSGAGNWGEWRGPVNRVKQSAPVELNQDTVLHYVTIPSSMDGQMICRIYQNAFYNIYFFYDEGGNCIRAYSDSGATSPIATGATIYKDGVEVHSKYVFDVYTTWTDGQIVIETRNKDVLIDNLCSTSINDPHYELYQINNSPIGIDTGSTEYSKTVYTDQYGNVVGLGFSVKEGVVKVNGAARVYLQENGLASSYNLPDFYAPTASGASGTVLVSAGNTAPVWQTLQTALGIKAIWTGTQAQYEALAPNYDNTTLYFIVEE